MEQSHQTELERQIKPDKIEHTKQKLFKTDGTKLIIH